MEFLMPYLVLIAVSAFFFAICYVLFYKLEAAKNSEEAIEQVEKDNNEIVQVSDNGAAEEKPVRVQEMTMAIPVISEENENAIYIEDIAEDDETKIMPTVVADKDREIHDIEATTVMHAVEMPEPIEECEWGDTVAVEGFLRLHGDISHVTKKHLYEITEEAFEALGGMEEDTRRTILENIEVQEALLCMQKAYCTTPTEWMRKNAIAIFLDVMQQPRSSTLSLVAFDALHILPRLSLGQFQAMALTLLFRYSINSNNYSLEKFQHYIEKYVDPFISELPEDNEPYVQMQYLQCIVHEEPISFMKVLEQNYPLVYRFMGAEVEEWESVLPGIKESLVESIVSPSFYKLPIINDRMAKRFFQEENIDDASIQKQLLQLMRKRPYSLSNEKGGEVLHRISPSLLQVNDIFNRTDLNQMKLSLLGLYLARTHVNSTIGEKFDLSRWF